MRKAKVSIGVYLKTRPLHFGKGYQGLLRHMEWPGGRRIPMGPKTLQAGFSPYRYQGGWHGVN